MRPRYIKIIKIKKKLIFQLTLMTLNLHDLTECKYKTNIKWMKVHRKCRYFCTFVSWLFLIFVSTIEDVSQFNQDNQDNYSYDIIQQTMYFKIINLQVL